jgi:hypothetical protein
LPLHAHPSAQHCPLYNIFMQNLVDIPWKSYLVLLIHLFGRFHLSVEPNYIAYWILLKYGTGTVDTEFEINPLNLRQNELLSVKSSQIMYQCWRSVTFWYGFGPRIHTSD